MAGYVLIENGNSTEFSYTTVICFSAEKQKLKELKKKKELLLCSSLADEVIKNAIGNMHKNYYHELTITYEIEEIEII